MHFSKHHLPKWHVSRYEPCLGLIRPWFMVYNGNEHCGGICGDHSAIEGPPPIRVSEHRGIFIFGYTVRAVHTTMSLRPAVRPEICQERVKRSRSPRQAFIAIAG